MNVNLSGSGMGAIIGRRGETLDAIQHLTNYAVNRGSEKRLQSALTPRATAASARNPSHALLRRWPRKSIKYKRSMALSR